MPWQWQAWKMDTMNRERGFDEQDPLGSIQQPGANTGSAPEHAVQPLSRPDSEQ